MKNANAGKGSSPRPFSVPLGSFNDNFVEVKSGLTEGEKVLLSPPRLTESGPAKNKQK